MDPIPDGFDPTIAHIKTSDEDGNLPHVYVFQVLNAEGTDWDEDATRAQYEAWKAQQP